MPRNRLAAILLYATLLLAGVATPFHDARAAGTVVASTREPVEDDGRWKLTFTVDVGTPPVVAHVPMLFVFTATMHYERALLDKTGDKPQLNRIPLQNQQPVTESLDVGFSDGSGKIFSKTKFDFVIRRDRGFEAGEYDLKIKREGDGVQLGQTIKLVLKGDNPIIDRRAIVFAGDKKKKVEKDAPKADEKKDEAPAPASAPPEEPKPDGDAPAPPAVDPKQGGCGCRVAGEEEEPNRAAGALALALGVALVARRRRGVTP